MDENNIFDNKEHFLAEVDSLIEEGTAIKERLYDFGLRMAKDGMLSTGAADAYIGMKATVEILNGLKDGKLLEQIEHKIAESEVESEMLKQNPNLNKYLN